MNAIERYNKEDIIRSYGTKKVPENLCNGFDPGLSPEFKLDLKIAVCDYYKENSPEKIPLITKKVVEQGRDFEDLLACWLTV